MRKDGGAGDNFRANRIECGRVYAFTIGHWLSDIHWPLIGPSLELLVTFTLKRPAVDRKQNQDASSNNV